VGGAVIDLHCHVLPGVDDGPRTTEGSLELARAAAAAGIETLVATPHVTPDCRNRADGIMLAVDELNRSLAREGIAVEVLPGAEVALSELDAIEPAELSRLGLGGGPWLLVEPPFTQVAFGLEPMVLELVRDGRHVVLAHPERCPALLRDRRVVRSLADAGVLMSITAASLVGRFGGHVRGYALELAREGLIHNVTSDAHDAVRRPPSIAPELRRAGLAELAPWLTRSMPAAIIAGEPLPPRPPTSAPARRRGWLRRG
jgi:protein-tyrosine phosphatase